MTFIRPVTPVSSDPVPDGSVTNAKVAATAAISADKLADGTNNKVFTAAEKTKLASGVIGTAVGNVVSFIGASAQWTRVNILNDPSAESGWADRLAFYFDADNNQVAETRTGYFNEYGEVRGRPAKTNTVAMRALGHANISTADIFQVMSATQSDLYFGVGVNSITCNKPITLTGTLAATGNVTAPNIGVKVSTGTSAPSSPAVGDIWVDTN